MTPLATHRLRRPQRSPNATHEALSVGVGSQESLPSLVTQQGGELTSMVWLNGEFRTKPWTQVVSGATPSPPDLHVDEVSGDESDRTRGDVVPW